MTAPDRAAVRPSHMAASGLAAVPGTGASPDTMSPVCVGAPTALAWASGREAAALDRRVRPPAWTVPMGGAEGASRCSFRIRRYSCGEVSGRCSVHPLSHRRPCQSSRTVCRQHTSRPSGPHAPPPSLDLSGGAPSRGQNDIVSVPMPYPTAGRAGPHREAAPDRQSRPRVLGGPPLLEPPARHR